MSDTIKLGVLELDRQAYFDLCEKTNNGYLLSSRQQKELELLLIIAKMRRHIQKCGSCGWCEKNAKQFLEENPSRGETK
jgi:hypothetical protein